MKKHLLLPIALLITFISFGQTFETPQLTEDPGEKPKVHVGADFAIQYQALNHEADSALIPLGSNFNLPTANLELTTDLAKGIRVNLTTYLSSRHHNETWVKGGYLIMDELPFFKSATIDNIMEMMTFKVGVMELNYGDAHFRRSDNGNVMNNPFVGNYIMDAFTTAPSMEVMFRKNGILAMAAVTSASLKPALTGFSSFSGEYSEYNMVDELGLYGKVGYDKEINEDLRVRGTFSYYNCDNHHFGSLYNGDRAGSRYYLIMNRQTLSGDDVDIKKNASSGRWSPGFHDVVDAMMLNVFTKFHGAELFGTYENAKGTPAFGGAEFDFTQIGAEGIYRFGGEEQFFVGCRYNTVNSKVEEGDEPSITRIQAGAGWNMTKNILFKTEYVTQEYKNFVALYGENASFDGVMVEAAIKF